MIWWDKSWNPIVGCTKCSPACVNCYAERLHNQRHQAKLAGADMPLCYAEPFSKVHWLPDRLEQPLHWRKPQRVFVGNMCDIFHPDVTDEQLDRIFAVMALGPLHTFLLLTKRPERMAEYLIRLAPDGQPNPDRWDAARRPLYEAYMARARGLFQENSSSPAGLRAQHTAEVIGWNLAHKRFPLHNIWLGTTVWDQSSANYAIPILLSTPAANRFVSVEPMLGPVDLDEWLSPPEETGVSFGGWNEQVGGPSLLDWVICGGETGPGARPMHPDWARSLRDQCQAADVPFFFKQWGEWAPWDFERTEEGASNVTGGHPHYKTDSFGRGEPKRLGARKAGRVLDGRTWEEVPRG